MNKEHFMYAVHTMLNISILLSINLLVDFNHQVWITSMTMRPDEWFTFTKRIIKQQKKEGKGEEKQKINLFYFFSRRLWLDVCSVLFIFKSLNRCVKGNSNDLFMLFFYFCTKFHQYFFFMKIFNSLEDEKFYLFLAHAHTCFFHI